MIHGILLSSTASSLPVSSVACQSSSGGPFESFPTSSLHSFAVGGERERTEREREREGRREKVKRDRRRKGREEGESCVEMTVTYNEQGSQAHHLEGFDVLLLAGLS